MDGRGAIQNGETVTLEPKGGNDNGEQVFAGALPCSATGQQGYSVRVLPADGEEDAREDFDSGLIAWWQP